MSSPVELGLDDHCFDADEAHPVQNLYVGHLVWPFDAHDGTHDSLVESLKLLEVFSVQCLSLTAIQETSEHNHLVHFDLGCQLDILMVHHMNT